MAQSYLGSLPNFDYKSGEWSIFKGKLTQFFKVNATSITADKKCAVLITHLSDDSYRLARNLVYPSDLEAKTYDELIAVLDKHFKIKKCSFANKAKFYSATKKPDESLGDWAARLRGLASFCDLGTALETVLTDRFVLGLGSGPERDKLFEQDAATLTFSKALEVAEQAASARQAQAMVGETGSIGNVPIKEEPVFRAASAASPGRGGARGRASRGGGAGAGRATDVASGSKWHQRDDFNRCNICGMKNHSAETCRYKGYKCGKCGVKGHLKKVCKLRFHNIQAQGGESETSCEDCEECALYNLRYEHYDPIILTVLINGDKFYMELDSGWGPEQEEAFTAIKREMASGRVLTHFDPEARLVLSVDAGPAGLGAVISLGPEGHERPLAFASRALTPSEKNYSQVHKEAAAIVYGVKHFHQYLYGRIADKTDSAVQANQSPPPPAPASAPSPRPLTFSPAPAPAPTAQALQPSSPYLPMSLSRPDAIEDIDQDINEPLDIASDNDFYECDDNNVEGEETDRQVLESETLSSVPPGPAPASAPASPVPPASPADSHRLRPRAQQQQLAQNEQTENQSDPVPRRYLCVSSDI
ncbi:uncharacterized protein LOC134649721 [Cydia amplana]|uniref:uncharacterized protein LOC134649721 n=1 Tax=Cydia amplana TaxID=1869771 RepID=UPI002FE54692